MGVELPALNSLTMVIRLLILSLLLTATAPHPAAAQVQVGRSMDDVRRDLAKYQPDPKRAELLLELGLDYVLKPGEYANDLDSAVLLIKQAEKINQRLQNKAIEARAYFVYSNALRERGNKAEGLAYIEKAVKVYRTLQEPEAAGKAWFERASYYSDDLSDKKEISGKRNCFDSARFCFEKAGDMLNEAFAFKNEADCDALLFNFNGAMKALLEALAIYKRIGYKDLQGVYDLMGNISIATGDYSDGVKYALLALTTAETVHDTTLQLCTVYNRLGIAYNYLGAQDKAQLSWKKALDIATKYHGLPQMRSIMYNLSVGNVQAGDYPVAIRYAKNYQALVKGHEDRVDSIRLPVAFSMAYTRIGDYSKAEKNVEMILAMLKKYPEWMRQMDQIYPVFVRYYMAIRQNVEARKYASIYLDIVISDGLKRPIATGYEVMASVDSALGNTGAALADYKNYKKYTDSVLNESTSFQFAEKEVEYETDKKDNAIKLLKQQEEIQQSRLERTRTMNLIVTISIAVLGLLLALVYNRYRIKQRLNHELEVKQRQINGNNIALQELVTEKDWLVREIHHRVKNNLQIVMSLLNSQSATLTDERALSAIRESQNRVQAISLLHQKLYQSENLAVIDMPSYVKEVTEYLAGNLDASHRIEFEVNVAPVALDVSQAVPLGLIINEAVTNAIKYAFPNDKNGHIRVSMETIEDGRMLVTIRDNGIGLPEGFDGLHSPSLGMSLMKGLSKQLGGEFSLVNHDGLTIQLSFNPIKIDHGKKGKERQNIYVTRS